jgi:hypothetical protein
VGYSGDVRDYRSNILSMHRSPMPSLDKGIDEDANLAVTSIFSNQNFTPFWMYGEFPMIYDPCGCEYENGKLTFELWGIDAYDINLTLRAQNYNPSNINTKPTSQNGFMDFLSTTSKVFKLSSGFESSLSSINEGIKKTYTDGETKTAPVSTNVLGLLKAISGIGGVTDAVYSVIDFFTSSKTQSAPKPTGVVLLNDLAGTGTMTSQKRISSSFTHIPGSNHITGDINSPYYDNPLGIMNIVNTPKLKWTMATTSSSTTGYSPPLTTYKCKLANKIDFVINQHLDIDLSKSDIKVFLEIDAKEVNSGSESYPTYLNYGVHNQRINRFDGLYIGTNLNRIGATKNGRFLLSSQQTPISCDMTSQEWYIAQPFLGILSGNSQNPQVLRNTLDLKISLKVVATLRKFPKNRLPANPEDDIVYIAKYAVDEMYVSQDAGEFTNLQLDSYPSMSFTPGSQPIELGENPNYPTPQDLEIDALANNYAPENIRTIDRININGRVYGTHTWISGNAIEINPGAEISPNTVHWKHCWEELFWNWWGPDWLWMCNDHYEEKGVNVYLGIDPLLKGSCYPEQTSIAPVALTKQQMKEFCKKQRGGIYYSAHLPQRLSIKDSTEASAEANQAKETLYLYPNPAHNEVIISYACENNHSANSYVTDMVGTKIIDLSDKLVCVEGKSEITLDISQWKNGIYLVVIENENGKIVKRLAVSH